MTADKIKGKVKWYSIRKGFGFISPTSDNAPTKEDIFFHQTSIVADAKTKFLPSEYEVEFEVNKDEDGKFRCQNVTAPGGGPCEVPPRPERKRRNKGKGKKAEGATDDEGENGKLTDAGETDTKEEEEGDKAAVAKKKNPRNRKKKAAGETKDEAEKSGAENAEDTKKAGGKEGRAPRKRFDDYITPEVKEQMKEKKLDMRQSSLLVQVEKARVKFGPDGYAALAHADGIMAEGNFTCDNSGNVTFTWKNMLKFEDGEWKTQDPIANTSNGALVSSLNWNDENVQPLKGIETPESLWGEDKTDPSEALQKNNFQMRKCFLSKTPGKGRGKRRPNKGKKGANEKNGERAKTNGKAENGQKGDNGEATQEVSS